VVWIGLLYYFNFVQVPFFAETDAPVRTGAIVKLVPRALWWFRWGAMATFLSGITYLVLFLLERAPSGARMSLLNTTSWGISIQLGALLGTIMFLNVWLVIWPKQKVVIANAVAAAGGAAANPAAPAAARRAFLASRTNVVFSVPMLFFMGAATHMPPAISAGLTDYWVTVLVVAALVELNALLGDKGPTKQPLEKIPGVIVTGFVVWAGVYAAVQLCLT
jgi:uncharacterized membrane protein